MPWRARNAAGAFTSKSYSASASDRSANSGDMPMGTTTSFRRASRAGTAIELWEPPAPLRTGSEGGPHTSSSGTFPPLKLSTYSIGSFAWLRKPSRSPTVRVGTGPKERPGASFFGCAGHRNSCGGRIRRSWSSSLRRAGHLHGAGPRGGDAFEAEPTVRAGPAAQGRRREVHHRAVNRSRHNTHRSVCNEPFSDGS